ncbi:MULTISPECIES: hypothetical protein [unclassified Microcoleus]|uniref:hypothetical protein n=1 Tax=unclassified Microcoleus TaxID=2642155 RepID=UPI001DDFF431|nr:MULTISPECIES: hypothetical protein [unclassified Microcoleus]MCC3416302.1 hypothetical protein [Microcoleus sp. PH2017_02_FOX_O_A]MCC3520104.1 hypothetical protein [Microcoleus sp. PH2017_18_LLB_O_A]
MTVNVLFVTLYTIKSGEPESQSWCLLNSFESHFGFDRLFEIDSTDSLPTIGLPFNAYLTQKYTH